MTEERRKQISELARNPLVMLALVVVVAVAATSPMFADSAVKIIGAVRGCAPCPCATPAVVPPATPAPTPASDPELEELGDGVPA